ncbi:hypothetical protein ES702_01074 [subsurface metagenome]
MMSFLPPPKSPTTSTILTSLILVISLIILILTVLLTTWATQDLTSYPTIIVASSTSTSSQPATPILAFPSKYNSYGLILNIIPGAGGTIDALLLFICFFSIDHIYIGRRAWLAKLSTPAAREGRAPSWLWAVTVFILAFSVCRSFVGFVGAMVGYYSSARFVLSGDGGDQTIVDGDGAYVAPDGKGFSVGGWTCQVKDYVVAGDGDDYGSKLRSLCMQEQAARWLTLPLLVCYSLLLGVVVARFMGEKRRVRQVSMEGKGRGEVSESE